MIELSYFDWDNRELNAAKIIYYVLQTKRQMGT